MKRLLILILWAWAGIAQAGPEDAVVCIPSHGGSGTIIGTGEGWTYVLTCWHCFPDAASQRKPITIDVPKAWAHRQAGHGVGIKIIALGNKDVDVALLRINYGPVPNVVPIAPRNHKITAECISIGFDSMRYPAQVRPARIVKADSLIFWTDARPWHGRSGGALIEKSTGYLVGVTHAYSGPRNHVEYYPGANGLYINHTQVFNFLVKAGAIQESPIQTQPQPQWQPYPGPGRQGGC